MNFETTNEEPIIKLIESQFYCLDRTNDFVVREILINEFNDHASKYFNDQAHPKQYVSSKNKLIFQIQVICFGQKNNETLYEKLIFEKINVAMIIFKL